MKFNKKRLAILLSVAAPMLLPSAHTVAAALEEIIVTAQRRAESIQDVPISVVAATQEKLESYGITNVTDLDMVSSGIQVKDSSQYIFPFIRGIGSFVQSGSGYSSVAIYVDGVFQPRTTGMALELGNVEQIEILKGPQATLYGRNATGGTMKITTKTSMPGDELSGSLSGTLGDYSEKGLNFYMGTGLTDTLAVNVSGTWQERDGFIENMASFNLDPRHVRPGKEVKGEDLDNKDKFHINGKLTWTPSDDLLVTLSGHRTQMQGSEGAGLTQLAPELAVGFANVLTTGDPANGPYSVSDFCAGEEWKTCGTSNASFHTSSGFVLSANYQMETMELLSLTSANWLESSGSSDMLNLPVPVFGFNGEQDSKNFGQEFQLTAVDGEGLDWMIGASYFTEESNGERSTDALGTTAPSGGEQLVVIFNGFPILNAGSEWEIEAKSVFGEVYYNLTDNLALTLGLRYTDESMDATPIFDGTVDAAILGVVQTFEDDAYTWRTVLDYSTDWGLIYGSVSTGFKSGGMNSANVPAGSFDSEEITAYEIGFKSTLADGTISLNGAAFMYDFTDIQTQLVGGATGGSNFIVNGDEADLSGIELELQGNLTDQLSIQVGATWLIDHEYTKFDVEPVFVGQIPVKPGVNVSGNDIVGAAQFNAVLGAQYDIPISAGTITLTSNINYSSGYYHTVDNLVGTGGHLNDDGYTRVNARIAFLSADESYEIALWGKNLTNDFYYNSGITLTFAGQQTRQGFPGEPRTYGVTAKYNF